MTWLYLGAPPLSSQGMCEKMSSFISLSFFFLEIHFTLLWIRLKMGSSNWINNQQLAMVSFWRLERQWHVQKKCTVSHCIALKLFSLNNYFSDNIFHLTFSAVTRGRGLLVVAQRKCGSVWNQYPMGSESSGTTMSRSLSFWNKSQRCVTNLSWPSGVCFVMINISGLSFQFSHCQISFDF